ncbi:MAG TPA: NADPH-dependent F420 reductase [Candidatus Acidoferrum sp.]|nr:NADPH-dependent F420 reductase [Candidatus Acidoferrum sp.]
MKIGIIGGTGRMGSGLALRLTKKHDVLITSRNIEKAVNTAKELEAIARAFYKNSMQGSIQGTSEIDATKQSETVIITVPPDSALSVVQELKPYFRSEQIVVSAVVSMKKKQGTFRHVPLSKSSPTNVFAEIEEHKSTAELIREIIKPTSVVSALHTVPASYLSNLEETQDIDVFVAGNEDAAVDTVSKLICEIPNLRPLKVGPLENSRAIESMTPLLLNVATLNNLKDPSIRIVPWVPPAYGACA